MGDRDEIIRKLKKLHEHAKSAEAIGSEAEAQAFGLKVQQMITQHNIDRAELETTDLDEDAVNQIVQLAVKHNRLRIRRRRVPWLQVLGSCIADAHYCEILYTERSSMLWFVGRQTQAEMALEVYYQLAEAAEKIADKEYVKFFYECKEKGQVHKARGFRQSFLEGFAQRMKWKYWEEIKRLEQEAAKKKGALVLFKSERDKVREFIEDMFKDRRLSVKHLKTLNDFETAKNPKILLDWVKGQKRWGVLSGDKYLIALHLTEKEANDHKDKLEDDKPAKTGKDFNREGHRRGDEAARKINTTGESQKELAS